MSAENPPIRTGIVCVACKAPVALVENRTERAVIFVCPACGHRWSAEEPGAPKH